MRILLTGAEGFLGRHTAVRLKALYPSHEVVSVSRRNWADLADLADGVEAILHVAGVNRGTDEEVNAGNLALASDVADAAWKAGTRPRIVFANSVQAGNGSPYGAGKGGAGEMLAAAAGELGSAFVDVRLPNLFGEGCRPHYNSFVATFAEAVMDGATPSVTDRELSLLHVQDAAQSLIHALEGASGRVDPQGEATSVLRTLELMQRQWECYRTGDIPPLTGKHEIDVFNTLRAAGFPHHYPIVLTPHADDRGRLVETVRVHGGQGQTFVSTTRPGITRGDHFHLTKVERFVVLAGTARINLRPALGEQIVSFEVNGEQPVAIDMPTTWVHNIVNVGESELTTLFWTHALFDPCAPDTFWEKVA
ncbi:MAG: polysaccharide biosynthesis C-terminal domain-containing protein [Sporichthyaceae bacterium]